MTHLKIVKPWLAYKGWPFHHVHWWASCPPLSLVTPSGECVNHHPVIYDLDIINIVFIDISPKWGLFGIINQIYHASVGILMKCLPSGGWFSHGLRPRENHPPSEVSKMPWWPSGPRRCHWLLAVSHHGTASKLGKRRIQAGVCEKVASDVGLGGGFRRVLWFPELLTTG